MTISLEDIYWLRLAARKTGVDTMPGATVRKLTGAQLIEADAKGGMRITSRGELALRRLAD